MKKLINILVIICIAIGILLGAKNMFFPSNTFEMFGIDLKGQLAFNTFRGAISGTFVGNGLLILMGLLFKNKVWYLSTILLICTVLIGRIYSIIVDGWTNSVVQPIVVEVFIIFVMYFAAKQLDASQE